MSEIDRDAVERLAYILEKSLGREAAAAPTLRALLAAKEAAEAERDGWASMVGQIVATLPLKDICTASSTMGELIAYLKDALAERDTLKAEAAALRERLEVTREGLETAQAQAQGTPEQCTGSVFVFDPGTFHLKKDGSATLVISEDDFELEDDRGEGPDGPEGSVHWLARLAPSEVIALRYFLNGISTPSTKEGEDNDG